MEGQSILNMRQVSVRDDLCQTGDPNGTFARSITQKTVKNRQFCRSYLIIAGLRAKPAREG